VEPVDVGDGTGDHLDEHAYLLDRAADRVTVVATVRSVTRASDNDAMASRVGPHVDGPELVDALRRGDEAAFAWLVDRYDGSLRRLARTYVATPAVAEEVVQDTWLAVVRGIHGFEGRAALSTWLYRILTNIAQTRGVREHRTIPFSSAAGALDEGAGPAVDPDRFGALGDPGYGRWAAPPTPWDDEPEARLQSHETLAAVQAAIDALPPAQREVITLRDVEGWTSTEVRNALDLTETNQRVLLHRARAKVRRALEAHFEEAGS
jgi:RNA polymerase sigma-70 factor (ECF subfamily)